MSTVHRVKGMEWPYVVVLGAHDGLMPHTLADDIEEERRIFHVAITRGDTAVHVVADAQAPVAVPRPARHARARRLRGAASLRRAPNRSPSPRAGRRATLASWSTR